MAFYRREYFEIAKRLETDWKKIQKEFVDFMSSEREGFLPYPGYRDGWEIMMVYASKPGSADLPEIDEKLTKNQEDPAFFPVTRSIVSAIPGVLHALFSNLGPGASISPHKDDYTNLLRCHLGILVPQPALCALRVAGKTKGWAEGQCLVFDRNALHEAWNRGSQVRVVLLVDFDI